MNKQKDNYKWVICFACTLMQFCNGGLGSTGFSVYQPYLISLSGLTNAQTSTMITFRQLMILVGMTVSARLIRRFEVRRVTCAAVLLSAAGFFLYSLGGSYAMYCAGASLVGFAYGFGGAIPVSIIISRWFDEHRGLALGLCMSATGLSAFAASPVINMLTQRYSLSFSFFVEAVFIGCCGILSTVLMHSRPSHTHAAPAGSREIRMKRNYAVHDAPRPLYIAMMAGIFLFGIPSNLLNSHISVLYGSSGFTMGQVSILISVLGLAMTIGKASYGYICDRFGIYHTSMIFYILVLAGTGLNCLADRISFPVALAAVALMAYGLAIAAVSIPMYAAKIMTEHEYSQTVTRLNFLFTLGSLLLGPMPGIIADMTGSYIPAFIILFIIALVSSILILRVYLAIRRLDVKFEKMEDEKMEDEKMERRNVK